MNREQLHWDNIEANKESYFNVTPPPEFICDGPSHWPLFEASKPRIVFLAKEAHSSFIPDQPSDVNNRFSRNIARWAYVIFNAAMQAQENIMLEDDKLQPFWDKIALVEVKKINDDQVASSDTELKMYAERDQFYLKNQIKILDPHVVVCCGTLDYFDIIFDFTYEVEKKVFSNNGVTCWLVNDMLVVDFYHPTIRKLGFSDEYLFNTLVDMFSSETVQTYYQEVLKKP